MFTDDFGAPYTSINSLRSTSVIGDERSFYGVRKSGTPKLWSQELEVERGDVLTLRVYVHVDAPASGRADLAATNVNVKVNLPVCTGRVIASHAFVASSAYPGEVWSGITLTSDEDFNLTYVSGSAKYENNWGSFPLPEAFLTSAGVPLGHETMDGVVFPGYAYSGYLSFDVRPQFAPT